MIRKINNRPDLIEDAGANFVKNGESGSPLDNSALAFKRSEPRFKRVLDVIAGAGVAAYAMALVAFATMYNSLGVARTSFALGVVALGFPCAIGGCWLLFRFWPVGAPTSERRWKRMGFVGLAVAWIVFWLWQVVYE